jgi:hypothetical protein
VHKNAKTTLNRAAPQRPRRHSGTRNTSDPRSNRRNKNFHVVLEQPRNPPAPSPLNNSSSSGDPTTTYERVFNLNMKPCQQRVRSRTVYDREDTRRIRSEKACTECRRRKVKVCNRLVLSGFLYLLTRH